ncbi:hypothetical protein BS47DRAFT_1377174 [Hydnum rufescens UP504]|uniref:Large ribosomal subunit protein uL2m n=1 Tax=Hydnum rufescens UP504 TaxID=1448309 RepID=A0A9P6AT51_9AGAM|nr:hypothetical protein BS47DRAFT_1377174 [Hydnum rufescens UP504]
MPRRVLGSSPQLSRATLDRGQPSQLPERGLAVLAPLKPESDKTTLHHYSLSLASYASPKNPNTKTPVAFKTSATTAQFKTYKPVTPGLRHLRRPITEHLYPGPPIRALTIPQRKKGGRNNQGRITVRHRGGGHKRRLRNVDFGRTEPGLQRVIRIEFDPGRSAHIALIKHSNPHANTPLSYILACEGLKAGDDYTFDEATASLSLGVLRAMTILPGYVLPVRLIPTGTQIHSIALRSNGKGQLVRSAGSFGIVHGAKYTQVRLQSGEVRNIPHTCIATIGRVSNPNWKDRSLGKAGRARNLGRRPSVRGVAMNAVDHPHGGGRGKSKGNKHPRSVWGWLTKGKRTRRPGPKGNTMVIKERPRGKEKRQT